MIAKKSRWWLTLVLLTFCQTVCSEFLIKEQKSWFDAFIRCQLATYSDALNHQNNFTAWAGALYVDTLWMAHEGCFKQTKIIDKERAIFNDNSPSLCSYYCRKYQYFSLMDRMCRCADKTHNVTRMRTKMCSKPCYSSKEDMCGASNTQYVNLFRHIRGEAKPTGSTGFGYKCSVLKVYKESFHLAAEPCSKQHKAICKNKRISEIEFTYKSAKQSCDLEDKYKSDILEQHNIGTYWTGIHRRKVMAWLDKETFYDICDEVSSQVDMKCILVKKKSQKSEVLKVPVDCYDMHHVLCSRRKEQTDLSNVTIAGCKEKNPNKSVSSGFDWDSSANTEMTSISMLHKTSTSWIHPISNKPLTNAYENFTISLLDQKLIDKNLHWLILPGVVSLAFGFVVAITVSVIFAIYWKLKRNQSKTIETSKSINKERHEKLIQVTGKEDIYCNINGKPGTSRWDNQTTVYDTFQNENQYHHLTFNSRQEMLKFEEGLEYGTSAVKTEIPELSINLNVQPNFVFTGGHILGNSLKYSNTSNIDNEYCQTRICHSQFMYDTPSAID